MNTGESIDVGRGPQYIRAQSETLGYILVFSMVILGSVGIVAFGATAISDTEESYSVDRAEKTLTQMDSKIGLVALEGADRQEISLPQGDDGRYAVNEGTGWMNITFENETGVTHTIENITLGEITYQGNNDRKVAYQGGGVWRSEVDGYSSMVSPPEFHYRAQTLTLPMISVSGDERLGNRVTVSHQRTNKTFPNSEENQEFVNPLERGQVNVTVQSQYYRGWGQYFEERTEGAVSYDEENRTVTVELIVPLEESFENVVGTVQSNGIDVKGGDGIPPEPSEQGVNYPLADSNIEEEIEDCETNGCTSLTDDIVINESETYSASTDFDGDITVDDPDGDVTIVIDGEFSSNLLEIHDMEDDESVTVYVRDDFDVEGSVNEDDGTAGDLSVVVHSDGDVEFKGNTYFSGLLYAPGSTCEQRGGGHVKGGVICDEMNIRGDPSNDFDYDPSITDTDIGLQGEVSRITFLHVSHNTVEVDSN